MENQLSLTVFYPCPVEIFIDSGNQLTLTAFYPVQWKYLLIVKPIEPHKLFTSPTVRKKSMKI